MKKLENVRPQEQVQRRTVEQIVDSVPVVPLLHTFVPQMVHQLAEVLNPTALFAPGAAAGGAARGRATARLRLVRSGDAGGDVLGSGQRRCWLYVVPSLWTTWGLLVACRRSSGTTQQKSGGEAAPPERTSRRPNHPQGDSSPKNRITKKTHPENKAKRQSWILAQ